MKVRAVLPRQEGETGIYDWVFFRGYSAYKDQQSALIQDIQTALYEFSNDCYWALDNGIDWLTRLGYHNQKNALDSDIYNCINNREGVLSISNFTSNVLERAYSCSCEVYTIYTKDSYPLTFSMEI